MERFIFNLTRCESPFILQAPQETPLASGYMPVAYRLGCRKCVICDEERSINMSNKWKSRHAAMIEHYHENGWGVFMGTLTTTDENYPHCEDELREWVRLCRMRLQKSHEFKGHWFIEGGDDKRWHVHVLIYVKSKIITPLWRLAVEYWTKRNSAYINHLRPCSSGIDGANYAAKYVSKQGSRKRQMSSQFGWIKFMEKRRLKWLFGDDADDPDVGSQVWEGYGKGIKTHRDVPLPERVKSAVHTGVNLRVVSKDPVNSVYKARQVSIQEVQSCVEKCEDTETLTTTSPLIYLPPNFEWLQSTLSALERLSRDLRAT